MCLRAQGLPAKTGSDMKDCTACKLAASSAPEKAEEEEGQSIGVPAEGEGMRSGCGGWC